MCPDNASATTAPPSDSSADSYFTKPSCGPPEGTLTAPRNPLQPTFSLPVQNGYVGRSPVRILVVEDDSAIREALVVALGDEGYEVGPAEDGVSALRGAEEFRPDLAIVDIRLPRGPDGLAVARRIREAVDLPVLFLTAADGLEDRLAGFAAGADDYIVKPFSMSELLMRVRAILRRSGRVRSQVWQVGDLLVDEAARVVTRNGAVIDLTHTEFELLSTLGRHRGQVLSKAQLLSQVWGYDAYDPNVVEAHISALRRKLEEHGPRLIHTVRGAGYGLRPP
jgi:two-component system, OmpR family, response regulator